MARDCCNRHRDDFVAYNCAGFPLRPSCACFFPFPVPRTGPCTFSQCVFNAPFTLLVIFPANDNFLPLTGQRRRGAVLRAERAKRVALLCNYK